MGKKEKLKSPVAERLRAARIQKGISQKQLGILAGMDKFSASPRINQYERNKHVPDFRTAQRLAETLDIPVTFLYADDDDLAELILLWSKISKRKKLQIKRLLINGMAK